MQPIDRHHNVALFTPDAGTLEQAASAACQGQLVIPRGREKEGLTPEEERQQAEKLGLNICTTRSPLTVSTRRTAMNFGGP